MGELSGRWTGTSSDGTPADITISSTSLAIITDGGSLIATSPQAGTFDLTLQTSRSRRVVATRAEAGGPLGIMPLPLSGAWSVNTLEGDLDKGCTTTLAGSEMSAVCLDVSNLPSWIGSSNIANGTVQAQRVEELASSFGALGGRWVAQLSGGGACELVFQGTTFRASCEGAGRFDGTLQVTVAQDVVSGSLTSGLDFSATRR